MNNTGRALGYSRLVKAYVKAVALASLAIGSTTAGAITLGVVDDFEDGTTQGWTRPDPPLGLVNVATGGPAGAGDSYLQITNGGGGDRLLANNLDSRWVGDWLTAGLAEIRMDVINLGANDLNLRLGIDAGGFGDNTDAFATNNFITLAPNSGWQTISFSVTPSDWGPADGGGATPGTDINATLANVALLRIYSNTNVFGDGDIDYRGETITGTLGVDNINAVPLPAAAYLFVTGLLGLAGVARRRTT